VPTRILIRHLSGSKVNQIEQFPLESFAELTLGRDPGSTILFDAMRDDAVSRRHAIIKIEPGDPPTIKIADLGSSNGTFVNDQRVGEEAELLPGDVIELGAGGPKFAFDVEPRPANLVARTRVFSAAGAATRITGVSGVRPEEAAAATEPAEAEAKATVGRNTVIRLLTEQKQAASRVGIYALAGLLVVIGLIGGAAYYMNRATVSEQRATLAEQDQKLREQTTQLQQQTAQIQQQTLERQQESVRVEQKFGLTPKDVVEKYGNATVVVEVQWRLYDRESGKPLFHKRIRVGDDLVPCYVRWNGRLYRWLTTEEDKPTNAPVGETGRGSGFVIDSQGLMLTNKHVAAGWTVPYSVFSNYEKNRGLLFDAQAKPISDYQFKRSRARISRELDIHGDTGDSQDLQSWLPEQGGPIFLNNQPVVVGEGKRAFEGRNEQLLVRFPGTLLDVHARLVRSSNEADAALIKIDATHALATTVFPNDDNVKVGDRVVVLGYPDFTAPNVAIVRALEKGSARNLTETYLEPTVTAGHISNISMRMQQFGNVTIGGTMGNVYQLTAQSSQGNSGGPVFNAEGQVIGIFTYSSRRFPVTYAVPIQYARALLHLQRPSGN